MVLWISRRLFLRVDAIILKKNNMMKGPIVEIMQLLKNSQVRLPASCLPTVLKLKTLLAFHVRGHTESS